MRDQNVLWFYDHVNPAEYRAHAIKQVLANGQSRFQTYQVLDLEEFGRALILDTKIQCSERDEFIYHETLVHPPMLLHPAPKRVLILGGGEGATAREVLRHRSVERCVMVDLDGEVVEACKKWLPSFHQGSFDHPNFELIVGDGLKFLADNNEPWDVIISDITEPVNEGPAIALFTREFFALLASRLTDRGVMITQAGFTAIHEIGLYSTVVRTIGEAFKHCYPSDAFVPAYGSSWGFVMAGKERLDVRAGAQSVDDWIKARIDGELQFYDGVTHQRLFALPRYVRKAIDEQTRVFTKEDLPGVFTP